MILILILPVRLHPQRIARSSVSHILVTIPTFVPANIELYGIQPNVGHGNRPRYSSGRSILKLTAELSYPVSSRELRWSRRRLMERTSHAQRQLI